MNNDNNISSIYSSFYSQRRKHRKRRRRRNGDEEEAMEIDDFPPGQNARQRRRERDISIRYMDVEDERNGGNGDHHGNKQSKSVFDGYEYTAPRRFTRTETCRVFIEGEGEVIFTDDGPSNPKYFSNYREIKDSPSTIPDSNSNNSNSNSNKNCLKTNGNGSSSVDTSDRLPSVFFKAGDRPADIIMEEDDEADANKPTRPLPFDLSLLDSSDEEEEEEESCLKEIFPTLYSEMFKSQRIIERLADIFITCLGVKGCIRLGPTMFRLFAR